MKLKRILQLAVIGNLLVLGRGLSPAQDLNCNQVTAIARMAASKSNITLTKWHQKAGNTYIARLVYSFRSFELNPNDKQSAARLLSLVPPGKEEEPYWHTLDGFLCKKEGVKQVKVLAGLQARLPRDTAQAVMLIPQKMLVYVSYAYTSIQDPHSDYAVRMQSVCRIHHKAFIAAVSRLSADDKQWFTNKIFEPNQCRALAAPEAD